MTRALILEPVTEERHSQLLANEKHRDGVRLSWHAPSLVPALPRLLENSRRIIYFIPIADFGFKPNARWNEVRAKAQEFRLAAIPHEYILPLRFAYAKQPEDEFVEIAHTPVSVNGRAHRFALHNNGEKLLLAHDCGEDDHVCVKASTFVFMDVFKWVP